MLELGKLYRCEEYFLLLYPDPETAVAALALSYQPSHAAAGSASYWSNQLGKPVLFLDKNIPLLVLNSKEKFYEVLAGDKKGWIVYEDFLNIKEIE